MDLQSTITLVGFAGFAVSLFGYLGAMKRDIRSEIRDLEVRVSERFDAMESRTDARFDAMESRTNARFESAAARTDARFESLETRFEALDSRFDSVDSRFDSVDSRFDSMTTRFDALDVRVSDLRQDMRAGFAATDARLTTLEQRTFDIGRRQTGTA